MIIPVTLRISSSYPLKNNYLNDKYLYFLMQYEEYVYRNLTCLVHRDQSYTIDITFYNEHTAQQLEISSVY